MLLLVARLQAFILPIWSNTRRGSLLLCLLLPGCCLLLPAVMLGSSCALLYLVSVAGSALVKLTKQRRGGNTLGNDWCNVLATSQLNEAFGA